MGIDDALDLRGRQHFFPLAGASLAEKPLGFFRAFAEAVFFFLLPELLKGRTLRALKTLTVASTTLVLMDLYSCLQTSTAHTAARCYG